jgi:hypothetical protein
MWDKRIACITYNKFPKENWRESEFKIQQVTLSSGDTVEMSLAERGTFVSGQLWMREVRKLSEGGHQTSILSTNYNSNLAPIASRMFARWSQENFFKYMRNHFSLDALISYCTEEISDTTKVVNPQYRQLNSCIRSKTGILNRQLAVFAAMSLKDEQSVTDVDRFKQKKALCLDEVTALQNDVEALKEQRKSVSKQITIAELPAEERFRKLSSNSKHFIDTIKMIAYRAETAMANILQENISSGADTTRTLLRAIYSAEADILPDQEKQTLTVQLHHLANQYSSVAIQSLCDELNATKTLFPGSNLQLFYKLVS